MANWGEFIKEFKILNMKSQGIYCKVDEVLDLVDERDRLRGEVAQLRAQVEEEREKCAHDVEEFAEACANEPNQPEYVVTVLQAAAELIRGRGLPPVAEMVDEGAAPLAEEVAPAEATVEGLPLAEPVPPGDEHMS